MLSGDRVGCGVMEQTEGRTHVDGIIYEAGWWGCWLAGGGGGGLRAQLGNRRADPLEGLRKVSDFSIMIVELSFGL